MSRVLNLGMEDKRVLIGGGARGEFTYYMYRCSDPKLRSLLLFSEVCSDPKTKSFCLMRSIQTPATVLHLIT